MPRDLQRAAHQLHTSTISQTGIRDLVLTYAERVANAGLSDCTNPHMDSILSRLIGRKFQFVFVDKDGTVLTIDSRIGSVSPVSSDKISLCPDARCFTFIDGETHEVERLVIQRYPEATMVSRPLSDDPKSKFREPTNGRITIWS